MIAPLASLVDFSGTEAFVLWLYDLSDQRHVTYKRQNEGRMSSCELFSSLISGDSVKYNDFVAWRFTDPMGLSADSLVKFWLPDGLEHPSCWFWWPSSCHVQVLVVGTKNDARKFRSGHVLVRPPLLTSVEGSRHSTSLTANSTSYFIHSYTAIAIFNYSRPLIVGQITDLHHCKLLFEEVISNQESCGLNTYYK